MSFSLVLALLLILGSAAETRKLRVVEQLELETPNRVHGLGIRAFANGTNALNPVVSEVWSKDFVCSSIFMKCKPPR